MPPPDFGALPPAYQHLLQLAKENYGLDVVPLEALAGGQTGAFLFLASVSGGANRPVEHFVVKFDRINEKAQPAEVERHRRALAQAPPLFAGQHMPNLAYAVEHEGAAAIFYALAGQSLQRFRTLASVERQSRLETLFRATNDCLLSAWNAEARFEQALHPRTLLERWLGYRLKPNGQIGAFLQNAIHLDPGTEGFLVQGQIFPNPLRYGLDAGRWQGARSLDALIGFQHGDLNIGNILARFAEDGESLEGYFLIDFALYKAQMPLLYDQCYLEMSYLVRELNRAGLEKWVALVTHYAGRDMPNPQAVPVELAGASAVINAGRAAFERWVEETHPSLSDDLWGQRRLAAVAAGLNYCNKPGIPAEARLAGLIYGAVHLKRYCAQFGVPLPEEVRLLYDARKWGAGAAVETPAQDGGSLPLRRPEAPAPPAERPAEAGARLSSGTTTFLFTDIEASTKLWEQFPVAMQAALDRHDAILREAVAAHRGRIIKTTGDGIHAAFEAAAGAVAAALAAQRGLLAEKWEALQPQSVRLRMGLHTGEAEARAGDYYGSAVNRAARLMAIGHGGQVLLSATTADLARDQLPSGASLRDLGEHSLKDLARAERVCQLVHPDLPADFPPLTSQNVFLKNLPLQLTTFIGREAQLRAVKELLLQDTREARLVTLTGPGGTGKTRLALQAASELIDRFEDGVFFVDLAPIREPEPVLAAVAQAVGLRRLSDRPLREDLAAYLRPRSLLLLLDNFEQVTAAAPLVADLLQDCPRLKALVTSREALRVRGEQVLPVPPLALPQADLAQMSVAQLNQVEAVRLFVERAQAVKPDFELTQENAAAVAELCLRLDGLPLAIELASARINLFTPQALLERVGSRLKLLRGGARDLALRQQTLRAAIDWSYDLLDSGQQRLFALLSVFSGGSVEAVEAVAGGLQRLEETGLDVLEGLASLVDKSLIRQAAQETGELRLMMLETICEYAAERLSGDPEFSAAAGRAHAGYYADFTQSRRSRLTGDAREAALAEIEADLENVRAAWRYWAAEGDLEQLGKFTDSLWLLNDARGWYHATVELTNDLLKVLAAAPPTPERALQEITLQTSLAWALRAVKGYTPEVEAAYLRALELAHAQGEIPQAFPVLRGLAGFYSFQADFENGIRMGEQILSLAERQNDMGMRVEGHLVLGQNLALGAGLRAGLDHLEKAIALYEPAQHRAGRFRLGNSPGVACLTTSALFLWLLGFPDRALERANEAVALARRLNHPYSTAYALFHAGLIHHWRREAEFVQARARAVLAVAEKHQFQIWEAVGACLHGAALAALGSPEEGLRQTQQGAELYQQLKTPPIFWPLLLGLQAEAYSRAGSPADALIVLDEALQVFDPATRNPLAADLCRLKGDLLLALSAEHSAEAERWLQMALDVARTKEARIYEIRAALSLSRLWQKQGKMAEARPLLRDACAAMTEGFATADLKEAQALLAELS